MVEQCGKKQRTSYSLTLGWFASVKHMYWLSAVSVWMLQTRAKVAVSRRVATIGGARSQNLMAFPASACSFKMECRKALCSTVDESSVFCPGVGVSCSITHALQLRSNWINRTTKPYRELQLCFSSFHLASLLPLFWQGCWKATRSTDGKNIG